MIGRFLLTLFGVYFNWAFPCWFVCPVLFLPWYYSVCDVSDFFLLFLGRPTQKYHLVYGEFAVDWSFCSGKIFGCYIWILCNVTLPNLIICYILFYVASCVLWKWFFFSFFWVDLPGHLILFVTFVYVALNLLFYHVYMFLICVSCIAWDLYSYLYHVLLFCLVSLDLSFCIAVYRP